MISILVTFFVIAFLHLPILVRLDTRLRLQFLDPLASFVTVLGGVGQHVFDLVAVHCAQREVSSVLS